jgi:hypothetical protein
MGQRRPIETYEVTFRDKDSGNRWTCFFKADSFTSAEKQAIEAVSTLDEIISITKDYHVA